MIEYALSHVTDEAGINSAMMLTGTGAHGAYHLAKFCVKHELQKRKGKKATEAEDTLTSDACSAYRGGSTTSNDPEIHTLLQDLTGSPDMADAGEKPFFWTGERGDLSYFWKKDEQGKPVVLKNETIEGIEDEAVRTGVRSTMAQARMEGLLNRSGDDYFLTDAGRKAILNPTFIKKRLVRECELYGVANENLDEMRQELENDRIDKKLAELGRTGEFEGCDRVTLNKQRLLVDDTAEDVVRFYVPSTARKKTVDIPKEDLIELDEKTFAAFLRKDKKYLVNGEPKPEEDVFRYFENKNKTDRIRDAADRGEQAAKKEAAAEEAETKAAADIFAGDEELSPKVGDGLGPDDPAFSFSWEDSGFESGPVKVEDRLHTGSSAYVTFPEGPDREAEVVPYKVDHMVDTKDGRHLYLVPEDPTRGDLLLPAEAEDHLVFRDGVFAFMQIDLFPEDIAKYAYLLEPQTDVVNQSKLQVPKSHYELVGNGFLVHPKDAPWESVLLKAEDVSVQADDSAVLNLRSNATYEVKSGDVTYTVTGRGAENLLRDVASPVRETTQKVSETVAETAKTTEKTVEKAAETVIETATTAASAVPVAGQALKVGEKVVGAGVAAVGAVNGLAAGDAKALVEAAAKAVPGAEIATKLGGLTQKL